MLAIILLGSLMGASGQSMATVSKIESEVLYQPGGNLKFNEAEKDFGQVQRGVKITYTFPFVNAGKGPLRIDGYHTACGCAVVDLNRNRTYLPQHTGKVRVELDTQQFVGKIVKTVTILTDNPLIPLRTLVIRADVINTVNVMPPLVDFGEINNTSTELKSLVVNPLIDKKRFRIHRAVSSDKSLVVGFSKENTSWLVTIQTLPPLQLGTLEADVWLVTNAPSLEKIRIPVRANVKGKFSLHPQHVEFGSLKKDQSQKRTIYLKGLAFGEKVEPQVFLKINGQKMIPPKGMLRYEIIKNPGEKARLVIQLSHTSNKLQGSLAGHVIFDFSDQAENLQLPFYAHLQ